MKVHTCIIHELLLQLLTSRSVSRRKKMSILECNVLPNRSKWWSECLLIQSWILFPVAKGWGDLPMKIYNDTAAIRDWAIFHLKEKIQREFMMPLAIATRKFRDTKMPFFSVYVTQWGICVCTICTTEINPFWPSYRGMLQAFWTNFHPNINYLFPDASTHFALSHIRTEII